MLCLSFKRFLLCSGLKEQSLDHSGLLSHLPSALARSEATSIHGGPMEALYILYLSTRAKKHTKLLVDHSFSQEQLIDQRATTQSACSCCSIAGATDSSWSAQHRFWWLSCF